MALPVVGSCRRYAIVPCKTVIQTTANGRTSHTMVDRERGKFWLTVGSTPVYSIFLCLAFYLVRPVGLEAVAYGIAGSTCVVATAASLLVVRHRVTDSAVPEEYPAAIRELLPISWAAIQVLIVVPMGSEPRWQLIFMLLATCIAVIGIASLLVVLYNWFTVSADTSLSPSHERS